MIIFPNVKYLSLYYGEHHTIIFMYQYISEKTHIQMKDWIY